MAAPILVIVAHPDLSGASRVHRRWVEELAKHPDEFEVRDLYALYPGGTMDEAAVAAERAAPLFGPPAPPAGAKKENPCARIEKPPFLFFFSLRPHFLGAYPAFGAKKENRSARI